MNLPPLFSEGLGLAVQALSLPSPDVGLVKNLIAAAQKARIQGQQDIAEADLEPLRDKIEKKSAAKAPATEVGPKA